MISKINLSIDGDVSGRRNENKQDSYHFTAIICFNLTEHKYYIYS